MHKKSISRSKLSHQASRKVSEDRRAHSTIRFISRGFRWVWIKSGRETQELVQPQNCVFSIPYWNPQGQMCFGAQLFFWIFRKVTPCIECIICHFQWAHNQMN